MKFKFFSPDEKSDKKVTTKEMLKEAVTLLVLEADYNNEAHVRKTLRNNILKQRKYNA